MLKSGDTVEEIATNRRGTVGESGIVGQPTSKWTVQFHDGKPPLLKDFTNEEDLRLVERSIEEGWPRLIPKNWIV